MKSSKYTVLLIPYNESEGKSFSFNKNWLFIIAIITISLFSIIVFAGYFFIPKTAEYQKMKEDYNKLAMERVKVMELFHDLQRLQQMDELLREKFGTDSDLSSFEFGYDSLNEASTINNHNNCLLYTSPSPRD